MSGIENADEKACRVWSSEVGPRPPDEMMRFRSPGLKSMDELVPESVQ